MAATQKFLFEESFDQPDTDFPTSVRKPPPPPPEPTYTRSELEAARLQARAEGHAAGAAEAEAAAEQRAAAALARLSQSSAELALLRRGLETEFQAQAATLVRAIAAKIAPALCRQEPLAEVEALLRTCLAEQPEEPRIVIRVADDLFDAMQRRLDTLATAEGFAGKLVLLADAGFVPGDCRIEWADGGAERNTRRLLGEIDAVLARLTTPAYVEETTNE